MAKNKYLNDFLLILSFAAAAVLIFLLFNSGKEKGNYVAVIEEGTEKARYSLADDIVTDISYNGDFLNILEIKDGSAKVIEANCPDKVCANHKKISKEGETIVCLPHKLVFKIVSDN